MSSMPATDPLLTDLAVQMSSSVPIAADGSASSGPAAAIGTLVHCVLYSTQWLWRSLLSKPIPK